VEDVLRLVQEEERLQIHVEGVADVENLERRLPARATDAAPRRAAQSASDPGGRCDGRLPGTRSPCVSRGEAVAWDIAGTRKFETGSVIFNNAQKQKIL
jgi:hypothetical protein